MKKILLFSIACLCALLAPVSSITNITDAELVNLSSEELADVVTECLLQGFTDAELRLKAVLLRKSETCEIGDLTCATKIASHTFKIASFDSNILSLCQGQGMLQASLLFQNRLAISAQTIQSVLEGVEINEDVCSELFTSCSGFLRTSDQLTFVTLSNGLVIPECANNKYRSINGFCNNLIDPNLGTPNRPFVRLLPPDYDDGLNEPRGSLSNNLPPPRVVSQTIMHLQPSTRRQTVTQMVKLWGQFLDHDITRTPESSGGIGDNGETLIVECCEDDELIESEFISPECLPLTIAPDDTFFTSRSVECLQFVRSLPADAGCILGPRQQMNEITAFHDSSNVYGSTVDGLNNLRSFIGGRLAQSTETEEEQTTCRAPRPLFFLPDGDSEDPSFRAGDTRVNEQPSLAAMHTIWMRVHNTIADIIAATKVSTDEAIFQESRRIVAALMQHITYREYLPLVIGRNFMTAFGLNPLPPSVFNSIYNPYIDPTIFNVFATAAFRFGHTLITNNMGGLTPFLLGDNFFTAGTLLLHPNTHPSSILIQEADMQALPSDALLDDVLTTRLAVGPPEDIVEGFPDHGNDLMALNIMRGRDHGIQGYNAWRAVCGEPVITSFRQLRRYMDSDTADAFSGLYNSVDDIDLFPAGIAENIAPGGGILGPTFSCILAMQFNNLKFGDRFYYENSRFIHNNNQEIAFTPAQLRLIKTTRFSEILCEVTCASSYPKDVFKFDDVRQKIKCGRDRSQLFVALEEDRWF